MVKVSVLWDIYSCPVPHGYDPRLIGPTIESALKDAGSRGPVTITAIGNLETVPERLLHDLFSTGITLKHIASVDGFQSETDLLEWTRHNPTPAGLMLICGPAQLERLGRTLYDIAYRKYVVALAYPKRKRQSAWLWKSFLSVVYTHWLWETLLEGKILQDNCSEADWFCTPCNSGGQSFVSFTMHLKSEEHKMKEPEPPNTPPATSTMVKSQPKEASVFWHINSCPLPRGYPPRLVGPRLVSVLKNSGYSGPLTITAIGNLEHTPVKLLQELSSTGIILRHVHDEFQSDLFVWKRINPPPATLMLICGHEHLELLSRTIYYIHKKGYNILLAYPQRALGSNWLWKSFLAVASKDWPWHCLLKGSVDSKQMTRTQLPQEKCSKPGGWICTVCYFVGESFEDFITHLKSEEHAQEESGVVLGPVQKPPSLITPPATSTMVKCQSKKTSVLWHINSCPVPCGYIPRMVGPRIVSTLEKSGYSGPFTITAVGNLDHTPDKLLQELASSGIALKHNLCELGSDLSAWECHNQPPATLMLICGHEHLENLSRTLYAIHSQGYTVLLAYPHRPQGSDWLWKSFLAVASKDWTWHCLLEGSVDSKRMTRRHVLQKETCSEIGDWFCRVCDFAGESVENFITHLRSEEHAQEESAMVARSRNTSASTSTVVKSQPKATFNI